jgi:hypothetical protein
MRSLAARHSSQNSSASGRLRQRRGSHDGSFRGDRSNHSGEGRKDLAGILGGSSASLEATKDIFRKNLSQMPPSSFKHKGNRSSGGGSSQGVSFSEQKSSGSSGATSRSKIVKNVSFKVADSGGSSFGSNGRSAIASGGSKGDSGAIGGGSSRASVLRGESFQISSNIGSNIAGKADMSPKARAKFSSLKTMRAELPAALGYTSSAPVPGADTHAERHSRGFEALKALRAELPAARGDLSNESGAVFSPTDVTSDSTNSASRSLADDDSDGQSGGKAMFPPIGNQDQSKTGDGGSAVGSESFNLMKRKIRKAKLQIASQKLAAAGSFQLPAVRDASPTDGGGDGQGDGVESRSLLASASGSSAVSSLAGESFIVPRSKPGSASSSAPLTGLAGDSFKVASGR